MNPSLLFRRRLGRTIALLVLSLGLIAVLALGGVAYLIERLDRVDRDHRLAARAAVVAGLLDNAGGGLRDHLASGTPETLRAYREAVSRAEASLDEIARVVADDPERSRRVAGIREQLGRWVEHSAWLIANRDRVPKATMDPAATARGAAMSDAIRTSLAFLTAPEEGGGGRPYRPVWSELRSLLPAGCGLAALVLVLLAFESWRRVGVLSRAFDEAVEAGQSLAEEREDEHLALVSELMRQYAIFSLDAEGRISSWNQPAERLLGYREDEVLDRHITCLYTAEDIRADQPHLDLDWATREGRLEDQRWYARKDGFRFKGRLSVVVKRQPTGDLAGFTCVVKESSEPG